MELTGRAKKLDEHFTKLASELFLRQHIESVLCAFARWLREEYTTEQLDAMSWQQSRDLARPFFAKHAAEHPLLTLDCN